MLVCSVSQLRRRAAIAADVAETATALDAPGTGNVVFATLVDDPASVNEYVDAYLGEIMLEAASAADTWTATQSQVFAADVTEAAAAADVPSVASAFTPATLTGLIGWWDISVFSSLSITSGGITAIADQSGGGNNLSAAGFGNSTYNATGFNGKPAVIFDVAVIGGCYQKTSFPMGTGNTLTAWFVGNFTATGSAFVGDARLLSYAKPGGNDFDNVNSWELQRWRLQNDLVVLGRNSLASNANATITSPNRVIITINSSGTITSYVNGVATAGLTVAGNWLSAGTFTLGSLPTHNNDFWNGPIAEAGVATGWHDATTAAALDNYLKTKWGL
jgi:hypothetical protein